MSEISGEQDPETEDASAPPLQGFRVLELADERGSFAGRLLSDLGADVIKLEPPGGSAERKLAPLDTSPSGGTRSLAFAYRNAGKRSMTLDARHAPALLGRLLKSVDLLLESLDRDDRDAFGLDEFALRKKHPGLHVVSIRDSGSEEGSPSGGLPIIDFAESGAMNATGRREMAPCNAPPGLVYGMVGTYAALGAVLALTTGGRSGVYTKVPVREVLVDGFYPEVQLIYAYRGLLHDFSGVIRRGGAGPYPVYPCSDGHVRVAMPTPWHWRRWVELIGSPQVLSLAEWADVNYRNSNAAALYWVMAEFTMQHTTDQLMLLGQQAGIPVTKLNSLDAYVRDPQTVARESVSGISVGETVYDVPRSAWRSSAWHVRPLNLLWEVGQDNQQIYRDEFGLSDTELETLSTAKTV